MSLNNSQEMKFLKSLGGSLNQLKIIQSSLVTPNIQTAHIFQCSQSWLVILPDEHFLIPLIISMCDILNSRPVLSNVAKTADCECEWSTAPAPVSNYKSTSHLEPPKTEIKGNLFSVYFITGDNKLQIIIIQLITWECNKSNVKAKSLLNYDQNTIFNEV